MEDIPEFEDAISETNDYLRNVLLGNGFSLEYDDAAFNYKHLLEDSNLSPKLKLLFEIFKTEDYERVIKNLETLAKIFNKKFVAKEFIDSAETLREDLIEILSNKHPKSQYEIEHEKK